MRRALVLRSLTAVVSCLALVTAGTAIAGWATSDDSTVVGYFKDAGALVHGSEVRAAGVRVGSVEDIELDGGVAKVTLDVDESVPLHEDARLTVQPVNLLGEHYVALDAGSPAEPFMHERVIPLHQTSSTVTLQDVLDTFDDPTAAGLASVITTVGEGMDRSGAEAAAAIRALRPAMTRTRALGDILAQQNLVLTRLLERVQPVAQQLASGEGQVMNRLVESTEETLSTLVANRGALRKTLTELPSTVRTARGTLNRVTRLSGAAVPTLRALRPVTGNLSRITSELHRFADAADPALASLSPVLRRADALLKRAAPVVTTLRHAGSDLRGTATNLRPLGDSLLDRHLADLMAFVRKWSLSTNGRDGLSHYFRGVVFVTPATLRDLAASIFPTGYREGAGARLGDIELPTPEDLRKAVPQPEVPRPDLARPDVRRRLPDARSLRELGRDDGPRLGNATGLTRQQEEAMLQQVLGGM